MEATATTADFARQIELATTKARCHEIAEAIGHDLLSRPHFGDEHDRLTALRIVALGKARKVRR